MEALFSLGERLSACASLVRDGRVPADIGTDHAYLPIMLVLSGQSPRAFASDINEEPIRLARKNIEKHRVSDKIKTFTANGLAKIPKEEADDIIIAGMGGDNIAAILKDANWLRNARYRLILQPMTRASELREYLYNSGFEIIKEIPVCEAERVYTVICAEYSGHPVEYDDFDIYAGRLPSGDSNAALLLKKQAGILRSKAGGCTAAGMNDRAEELLRIAARLDDFADGRK